MIRELISRFEVSNPAHVAKVGDTPADLDEGRNAGCGLNLGVYGGTHSWAELEPFPHVHLIDDIGELADLLGLPSAGPTSDGCGGSIAN
jgi:phosphoglycolate phosphatase-like HAD superfamily hydrolase